MTGRGAGYCAGFGMPGYAIPRPGRGFGMGGGGGRGHRHWFYATGLPGWMRFGAYPGRNVEPDRDAEERRLESHARDLESELKDLKNRIERLERGPAAERAEA